MDNDEEHVRHSKSENIEIMINVEADEITKELSGLLIKIVIYSFISK